MTSGNSLFVEDDEDMRSESEEVLSRYQPSTAVIKEEDEESTTQESQEEGDDDPVIESIPLFLNTVPSRQKNSLHVLQFPGRPKTRTLQQGSYHASIKPQSQYLEIKVPLDTSKFFDVNKVEEWGNEIGEQGIQGVLDKSDGGCYAAKIVNDDNQRKIVLIPIDSTAQLRTSFQYIDAIDNNAQLQRKQEAAAAAAAASGQENAKPANVQILQTAAKIGNNDGFSHSLGESLRHVKKFDEENWDNLVWKNDEDGVTKELKKELINGADGIELTTETKFDDYIQDLIGI
ncbi:uncharacterized protein J8A68_001463 [[Candida] subhashii]|uniref:DNA-directed RNA polymerase III subunit RPC5 n=1 Tax=[Candida] subhashii TaxID=561895 RepID=A0A8J5UK08_9ASCO|nr:uncharacterized protein J8A68_001463 [[Candida] subhashii]KAG7664998.1 hypothetical protein J8A68_001463 [[Candida] subhashii]